MRLKARVMKHRTIRGEEGVIMSPPKGPHHLRGDACGMGRTESKIPRGIAAAPRQP